MSNDHAKPDCLKYPGQPDNITRDELIEYFKTLAAKANPPEIFEGTREALAGLTVKPQAE